MRDRVTEYCRETAAQRPRDCHATKRGRESSAGEERERVVLGKRERESSAGEERGEECWGRERRGVLMRREKSRVRKRESGSRARELETDRAADQANYRKG